METRMTNIIEDKNSLSDELAEAQEQIQELQMNLGQVAAVRYC